ncbi:proteobacterial dedicated sortase system histidine kinase [Glaciecola sp. XM2]|jgi:dedicated sortase system histidine kinase|uniref:proteobacterial dedicated sortase system histidine kinase n=1 Tax=Glaciecola sp. XM2 TaxID=1914931 RepID=UPI001BDDE744|nr:proteobacterial dedicated sortase system histidine kinase [Glaciecola sp. XM2]MBT1451064.1 proteobacterial dedicated sortase system histidine kinase [Glaciecola sp. XM2]
MKKWAVGIRTKLLLFSSFLLVIPYLGYQFVWELETYLRIGQEQTLVGTARAVATALHERPALFNNQSAFLSNVRPGKDLYAHRIAYPIQLDGRLSDWQDYQDLMIDYGSENLIEQSQVYRPQSLNFKHMVGQFDKYLYAMFEVTDDSVLYRPQNALRIDRNDYVQIALINAQGEFNRFAIAPYGPGWVNAFRLDEHAEGITPLGLERAIQGQWRETDTGYILELRFPLSMLSSNIAFAITDVDDPNDRRAAYVMGTADPATSDDLGTVLIPSPNIERIIKGLKYSNARVWVVDKHMRVLARSGDIQQSAGVAETRSSTTATQTGWFARFEHSVLKPLYYRILTRPPNEFIDDLADAFALQGQDIANALQGAPDTLWRLSPDNKAVILSAAHPIFIDGDVMGAVVVEQTTHGIRTLRNQALEKQFNFILAVMLLGVASLFLIASRISTRIRRLRDNTESAIDANGKIIGEIEVSRSSDEIGDLSRSFQHVLTKLTQYNHYLENMASRLSHELRTPVAVVNSSLDNLMIDPDAKDRHIYVERAKQGISRLSKILNSMSEATRLEEAIKRSEHENFVLNDVLKGCVEGFGMTHPDTQYVLENNLQNAALAGSPELFAQMLDKVLSNATEFCEIGHPISIRVFEKDKRLAISISNRGPLLPANMQQQLLESMVSVRASNDAESSHLGLGLFIANMIVQYHHGKLSIDNLPDHTGVIVLMMFDKQ